MKTINVKNEQAWKSITHTHMHDSMLQFDTRSAITSDGLSLNIPIFNDLMLDQVSNNHSRLNLTKLTKINDLLKLKLPTTKYPEQFTTSLLCNAYPTITNSSAYIYIVEEIVENPVREYAIGETADAMTWIWAQDITTNAIYYTVTLHDETTLSINHNDNVDNVFLTYDPVNLTVGFKRVQFDIPQETEKFNYFINNDQGFLLLYKEIDGIHYYVKPDAHNSSLALEPASTAGSNTLPLKNVLKFVLYKKNSLNTEIANNWVSYETTGGFNNLNVNQTKSYYDITNNYMIDYQYKNIDESGNVPVSLIQLKNQLSVTGDTNRENPFPNMRDCDHRDYNAIFDSNTDTESLYFGYSSYETEITLEPDKITYFNAPQDMYPLDKLNINDSGLIKRGAIGGDTPLTSDKIFKKAATYKYNTAYGKPTDEESGVWLCSWLKSNLSTDWESGITYNENVFVNWENVIYKCLETNKGRQPDINSAFWERTEQPPPVWVDRYYNPAKYTVLEAMKFEGQYSTYKPKFDHIVEVLDAQDSYIFDKISDLTFEPGCLYAYYRIGEQQIKTIVDNVSQNLIHDGLEPAYNQDRSNYVNIDNDKLTFTGTQYIESTRLTDFSNNDFTVSFNMSLSNWENPIGTQIVGNYTNHGMGIFNKRECTPYVMLPGNDKFYMFNTNLNTVLTLNNESGIVSHSKQLGNEDIILYNSLSANTYDTKGMLVETTSPVGYVNYRNENKQVYITADVPGIPGGILRLPHAFEFGKTIIEVVDDWNGANPDFQLTLGGEGSILEVDEDGNIIKEPWIPEIDIIVTPQDLLSPAGRIVDSDIDNNYKYILDEHDNIFRFDLNNESYDSLNNPYPFNTILGLGETDLSTGDTVILESSNKKYIKTVADGEYQYIMDCDDFTIDMYDQPWFVKDDVVYKYTLNEQLGINASWQGVVEAAEWEESGEVLLVASNNYNGSVGNDITIIPDGVSTLNTLVNSWNEANRNNTVNIVEGDRSIVPVVTLRNGDPFIIKLDGGVDRGSTTTSVAFSGTGKIRNITCDHENNIYLFHQNKLTRTGYLRDITHTLNISDHITVTDFDQSVMDLVTEFDTNGNFYTYILVLYKTTDHDQLTYIKFKCDDLSYITHGTSTVDSTINLNNLNNITGYETFKQLSRDTLNDNYLTCQIRYQSYFDTDKTSVKKLTFKVSDLTPGKHHFAFAYNSNNSNLSLFVDGVLKVASSSDDSASGAAYKFSKTIQSPVLVGAEPFFNNVTFAEHLGIDNYAFAKGFSVSNYRLFNEYLNFQRIKMLAREGKEIQPMKITLPAGKRNYIDRANKFFKHKEPGKKSDLFDINITCASITGTDIQQIINKELVERLESFLPVNTGINTIDWVT